MTTAEVRFSFQADGRSLREAHTAGAGKLVIVPADPRLGEREVTAGQFLMAFDTRNRLESLRGVSGTEIVFHPSRSAPSGTPPATTSSERLEATFDPATQALRRVQQMGNFQFREGDRQASATQADYASEAQILTLAGSPLLWDSQTRTRADRIFFNLRTDTAEGVGKVQSTHFGNGGRSQADWRGEPINVLADRVVAQRESELVHYEGNVRVWHGQDVVESSSLDVYRKERRVGSGFRVLTSHLQPASRLVGQGSTASATSEKRPVTIRADRLEYFDEGRKASYRGNVQLRAENTTLQAERIDVYFLSVETVVGSQVERAVGDGQVRVEQPGRRATGQHAEYFANEGKILLSGGPPTLYDVEKGFTTGRRLTFFIHDDSLLVEGGDESRTLSRHRIAQ